MTRDEFCALKVGQHVRLGGATGTGVVHEIINLTTWEYGGVFAPMSEFMIEITPLPSREYIMQIAAFDRRDVRRLELVDDVRE